MEEIICFFKGHKGKLIERKIERLVFLGETAPQYRTEVNIMCERCGKWQSSTTGKFLSTP